MNQMNNNPRGNENRNSYPQNNASAAKVEMNVPQQQNLLQKADQFTDKALDNKLFKTIVLVGAAYGTVKASIPVAKFVWNKAIVPAWKATGGKIFGKKATEQPAETTEEK